ncbi:PIN2/TERF1-interacting telomerase inhibitor 1 [Anopheles maculipalpis]|uniref:PIN2/TERF1-interacting telomerase inhibitor 1 n=1 Tax=Anopheles maculipalpis TaxID=1496333 RepID=UPI0021595319|nr:PIN2/TERF1-interacting telomerase inhibitor 1 [Anopheles maculipalpis]
MEGLLSSVAVPSMKERQKRLCQERQKERHRPVYEDSSNFGVRMLAKLGWSEGKGLGKHENGIAVPVAQRFKRDTEGVGFVGGPDDQWTQHDAGFNDLLKQLNGEADVPDDPCDTELNPKAQLQSLEERSKTSRVRVHYKKFTRGKDLSQVNEKDLANIFGKRSFAEINKPVVAPADNNSSGNVSDEDSQQERPVLGLSTIKASMSIQEYFKEKMKQKSLSSSGGNGTKCEEQSTKELVHPEVDSSMPKKKKSKNKNEESLPIPVEDTVPSEEVSLKKHKRKREKVEPVEEAAAVEDVPIEPEKELSEVGKKRKKSIKQIQDPESSIVDATDEMGKEDLAEAEEPVKKKKKPKKSKIDASLEVNITNGTLAIDEMAKEEIGEAIAEEPTKKKKKSKKSELEESIETNDEEELTCKVKVHMLKYLDESRFKGSNFGDIIGYRLTEQVKLIKNEARSTKWKRKK